MDSLRQRFVRKRTELDEEERGHRDALDRIARDRSELDSLERSLTKFAPDLFDVEDEAPIPSAIADEELELNRSGDEGDAEVTSVVSVRAAAREVLRGIYPQGLHVAEIRERAERIANKEIQQPTLTVMLGRLQKAGEVRLVGRVWYYTLPDAQPSENPSPQGEAGGVAPPAGSFA